MKYNADFTIIVSQTELEVIRELRDTLNRCPYDLTCEDFAYIIEAIANKLDSADNVSYSSDKTINIVYEEEEK